MPLAGTLRFILRHPLSRGRRLASLARFLRWQIGARLVPGPVAVDFVNDARLLAAPGLAGATGNVYVGLHEFEDMAFLLHALRPGDLFVDVGANIGSYTVLAAVGVGCGTIAFEPGMAAFSWLQRNIALNSIGRLVEPRQEAVGAEAGVSLMTAGLDTVNHMTPAGGVSGGSRGCRQVPVTTLDGALQGRDVFLMKIDVEGFETAVVDGGARTFANPALRGVLMELIGGGGRYGYNENALRQRMAGFGFAEYRYDPFSRRLRSRSDDGIKEGLSGNTLFLRDIDLVKERIETAPPFTVLGRKI